jgi:hypothetical protein
MKEVFTCEEKAACGPALESLLFKKRNILGFFTCLLVDTKIVTFPITVHN